MDFLIETGEEVTPWFPGGLIADLEDLLGRSVDVAEKHVLNPHIRDRVLAEAVAV